MNQKTTYTEIERKKNSQSLPDDLIEIFGDIEQADLFVIIKSIFSHLRPDKRKDSTELQRRFDALIVFLRENQTVVDALQMKFAEFLPTFDHTLLLADSGVSFKSSILSELMKRIRERILPPIPRPSEMSDVFESVFSNPNDYQRIKGLGEENLSRLWNVLDFKSSNQDLLPDFLGTAVYNAILILSNRISAMGLEPEILTRLPNLRERGSSFLKLNTEVGNFVEVALAYYRSETKQLIEGVSISESSLKHHYNRAFQSILECEGSLAEVHENQEKYGVSQSLVYLLNRSHKAIRRLKMLLEILNPEKAEISTAGIQLFLTLVESAGQKRRLKEHFTENTAQLAYTIAEHTSKTGENYITSTPKEYARFLRDAMGGGFLVSFTNWIKVLIATVSAAPLAEAVMYSINYAGTFITMHFLHFSLATKQPAMTASSLAKSLDFPNGEQETLTLNLENAAQLISKISRSQFAAFLGNLGVVFPVAFILSWIWLLISGNHIAAPEKAISMLESLHPFQSLSIFYAAITGVILYISSLISGYYDNQVRYAQIHLRVKEYWLPKKLFTESFREKITLYIEQNLGALAGNFFLGVLLGSLPILGKISGLPIDIRHVTIAAGSFSIALASLWGNHFLQPQFLSFISIKEMLLILASIFSIGAVNFLVSFGLALSLALSSRRANFQQAQALSVTVLRKFLRNPIPFLFPPKERPEK